MMVHRADGSNAMKNVMVRVKGILALLTAVVADAMVYFEDDVVTPHEWVLIAVLTIGALGTYAFPNTINGRNVIDLARYYELSRMNRFTNTKE